MRKALIIGINYYENVSCLSGCVNDALAVQAVLERHSNGTKNFDVETILNVNSSSFTERKDIFDKIKEVFDCDDTALFYFSGHGGADKNHGFLALSEFHHVSDGVSMSYILTWANESKAKNKIIILDCCHAGQFGTIETFHKMAALGDGITILSACKDNESAIEENGGGLFTHLLVDALNGSAADLVGQISPGSVYAHIDQSLGAWEQRPVFKTNVQNFISLRNVLPSIETKELQEIINLFPKPASEFALDPSYEYTSKKPILENVTKFKLLQKMFKVNLVRPIGEEYMYDAAINSKKCSLTPLGKHYWDLVNRRRI